MPVRVISPDFPAMPNALLINFGTESSYLTVIWGRRTVLDRVIEFSDKGLLERLQERTGYAAGAGGAHAAPGWRGIGAAAKKVAGSSMRSFALT